METDIQLSLSKMDSSSNLLSSVSRLFQNILVQQNILVYFLDWQKRLFLQKKPSILNGFYANPSTFNQPGTRFMSNQPERSNTETFPTLWLRLSLKVVL